MDNLYTHLMIPALNLRGQMLAELGYNDIAELFDDVPSSVRIDGLNMDDGLPEQLVKMEIDAALAKNKRPISFIGAGCYDHYVPSAVRAITSRSEFYTSYTPYQPEVSQGMLQTLFEYQSMLAELVGLEVVNASMYDAATALGEAALMCHRLNRKTEFIVPKAISWEREAVLSNYVKGIGMRLKTIDYDAATGQIDTTQLEHAIGPETSGVYIETPNYFGLFEERVAQVREMLENGLLVMGVNPLSLALIRAPGEYDADIVIGDGQPLGNRMDFGGGAFGIFACKRDYIRRMPGRVIGLTKDKNGQRAFCMVLQTREQHIRRAKATSNICTNESLKAIAAAVYLALLGEKGLRTLAELNISKAAALARSIDGVEGFKAPLFKGHHFNEFVVGSERPFENIEERGARNDLIVGLNLSPRFPELGDAFLCAVTELHGQETIDQLLEVLRDV